MGLLTNMVELESFITGSKVFKYILCEIIFNVVIYTIISNIFVDIVIE